MKQICKLLLLTLSLCFVQTVFAEYTPPTESELDQLLANPRRAPVVVQDATGQEAAELLVRILNRILGNDALGPQAVRFLIAQWTATILEVLPSSEFLPYATYLAANAPEAALEFVYAGLSIGGAGNNTFLDELQLLAEDNEVYLNAVIRPETALTRPVYNLLVSSIATSQTLPPSSNITTPIVIPEGGLPPASATPPPQPPVPEPYDGQR